MAAKRTTARKTTGTARKRTAARSKKLGARKPIARKPKRGGIVERATISIGWFVNRQSQKHIDLLNARRDMAILRETHQGCPRCKGLGQIHTKKKDGSFSGSKPCPARPVKAKASRTRVAIAARFGPDKSAGLVGWTCPCGAKDKPRFRDAKTATAALRTHEKRKHGGSSVGGRWYTQMVQQASAPVPPQRVVSKKADYSGLTDQQWEAKNGRMHPDKARAQGKCWHCSGNGANYTAFGGEQRTVVCPECSGSGRAKSRIGG